MNKRWFSYIYIYILYYIPVFFFLEHFILLLFFKVGEIYIIDVLDYIFVCYSTPSDPFPMQHSTLVVVCVIPVCVWEEEEEEWGRNGDLMFASSIGWRWWKTHSSPHSPPSPDTCPFYPIFLIFLFFFSFLNDTYAVLLSHYSASPPLRRYIPLCIYKCVFRTDSFFLSPLSFFSPLLLLISKSSTSSIILSRDHLVNRPTRPLRREKKGGEGGGGKQEGAKEGKGSCYIEERWRATVCI